MKLIVTLLFTLFLQTQTPKIEPFKGVDQFHVSFEAGAVGACTVFDQKTKTVEPYAFRSCHAFNPTLTEFLDDWDLVEPEDADWDVYAEIYYDNGSPEPVTVESNHLKVHR